MNLFVFSPVFGLALWLGAIYVDSKFSYKTPEECNIKLKSIAPWWKRAIVHNNNIIKYGALFALWGAISADVYLFGDTIASGMHYILIAISVMCIIVYLLAQAWRFLMREADKMP